MVDQILTCSDQIYYFKHQIKGGAGSNNFEYRSNLRPLFEPTNILLTSVGHDFKYYFTQQYF